MRFSEKAWKSLITQICRTITRIKDEKTATGEKGDVAFLLNSVLAAVGEDIVLYIFLGPVNSEVTFAKNICVEVE